MITQTNQINMTEYERRKEVSNAVDDLVQALVKSGEDSPYAVDFALGALQTLLTEALLGNSVDLAYIRKRTEDLHTKQKEKQSVTGRQTILRTPDNI